MNEPEIALANESELHDLARRRCADDASRRVYLASAQHAARGVWVARDAGTPIGIAFAREFAFELFVSELFVEPSFRNAGIGMRLLRAASQDASDLALSGLAAACDPASIAFALHAGLGLHVPVLRIAGEIPRDEQLVRIAAGTHRFATLPIEPGGNADELDALDREIRATAKPREHDRFAASATGTAFVLDGDCVGYVYVWPDGRIGPLGAASAAYLPAFFAFGLAALRRTYRASWCTALVPGSNARVLRAAVTLGLRVEPEAIFASDRAEVDLGRYVGFHASAF